MIATQAQATERNEVPDVRGLDAETIRAAFVAELTGAIPPRPLNVTAIEATNRGHADLPWAMLTSAAAVPELTVEQFAARDEKTFIVDVREPADFLAAHVPGAVNIP